MPSRILHHVPFIAADLRDIFHNTMFFPNIVPIAILKKKTANWYSIRQTYRIALVGAKLQEAFSLSTNERSAVGGRRPAVGGRVGQIILGGRLSKVSSRKSAVGAGGRYF